MKTSLPYATREIDLDLAGYHFRLLEVADTDALLDAHIREKEAQRRGADEEIPYWAELWPSALGLPGIAAGKLGAPVTLSDYLQPALEFARSNWELNNETPADLLLLDWRRPASIPPVDLLLASDITYDPANFPYLPEVFRARCKPEGRIILSDPRRQVAQPFFRELPDRGFTVERVEEVILFRGREIVIHIYCLERKNMGHPEFPG